MSASAYASSHAHTVSVEIQKNFIKNGVIKKGMDIEELNEIIAIRWFGGVAEGAGMFRYNRSKLDDYCGIATEDNNINGEVGYCFNKNNKLIQIWEDPIAMAEHWLQKVTHKKDRKRLNKLRARLLSENSKRTTKSNTASSSSGSSSMSMKDKITQAKQVCTDLGFQQKTEKHADCSMQMMSIQFETTNKVSSASGGTTQEVIVTHRNDYDIWDALLDFSAAIDPKNKTTTSSSSSNRGTNCVVGRTNPTFGTTTINCN